MTLKSAVTWRIGGDFNSQQGGLARVTAFALLLRLFCCLSLASYGISRADDQIPLEYQVKAAFLLNFTKFIEWPTRETSDEDSPISICIWDDDPFGQTLDDIVEGETVNSRKLVVQRIEHELPKSCHVLFIGAKSKKDIPKVLESIGPGVLTVGEGERFLHDGGMIAFVIDNRRVRFDINQSAARNAKLRISSKLLNVARSVK